uniref:F-box protein Hrt3/FBXO9 C-terminal domain-containing protein n=1 Tax=Mucochytrium quahogii TaxID=96639 RepID=A0A7S2RJW7_9STRA|mmetsp:Transcript_15283/g.24850  ORF Transcript_15283/g.24850 Transcript_15283/m.24850 type:complete len:435 (-) Transcript_15283:158-1462(-)|eukprot:CAMPEP_0203747752 /NCGR_PEP_ID=MMETSP0098-20131031/2819_1 /ASSEMBLY_ACC=CAM_ASM_000208 /TAXON_ID=96639 /ORGANISM=" , Strain NY0313808BC1" /LENGTH=434 /DNA_ID=CAMNT_0050636287 /DNA_START=2506 /DNA_END=3810 /DNA_ORIENTATION=-
MATVECRSLVRNLEEYQESEALRIALESNQVDSGRNPSRNVDAWDFSGVETVNETTLKDDQVEFEVENPLVAAFKVNLIDETEEVSVPRTDQVAEAAPKFMVNDTESQVGPASFGQFVEMLSKDLLMYVLVFLDEDSLDMCKVVNVKWYTKVRSEVLWKAFCLSVFKKPAYREINIVSRGESGKLVPKNFPSWYETKLWRPRVRMETGLYVLQTLYFRSNGPRSMWSENYSPYSEVTHYRYLLFKPNGTVLYASTPVGFKRMSKQIKTAYIQEHLEKIKAHSPVRELAGDDGDFVQAPSQKPVPVRKRKKNRKGKGSNHEDQASAPSKVDSIYTGRYTVNGKTMTVVLDLITFTVMFTMELDAHGGSHDRMFLVSHKSVYHSENGEDAVVVHYSAETSNCRKTWWYYPYNSNLFDPVQDGDHGTVTLVNTKLPM